MDHETIHKRIVDIAALVPGIKSAQAWWPESGRPFDNRELPVMIVVPAPTQVNQILSGSEYQSGQDWYLELFVKRFPGDSKVRHRETWDLVRSFARSVPDTFNKHRYLQLNDAGIVKSISIPAVQSWQPDTLDGALYASISFRMTVYTIH